MLLDIKKLIKLSILSWSYILVIFLYVISSFLDIVGLGLLGVFISFFLDGQNSNSSFILNFLFVDKIDFIEPLVTIGILLLLVFFLKLIFFSSGK